MRIYDIALFMLLLNVVLAFTANQQIFSNSKFGGQLPGYDPHMITDFNISEVNESGYKPFGESSGTSFILSTLTALGNVVDIFWRSTLGLQPSVAQMLGGDSAANDVAWLLAAPSYLVYFFAIAQFLRGWGAKGAE